MRSLREALAAACLALTLIGCGSGASGGGAFVGDDGGTSGVDATAPGLGGGPDATAPPASTCTPRTCAQAGANCGPVADGCGNLIQSCGDCTAPATCGGGGTASQCGGTAACVPKTCKDFGGGSPLVCGDQGDGCGNVIHCGTCTAPATCGGGGTPSVCGGNAACIPLTTCPAGENCGAVTDLCGGVVSCGGGVPCPTGTTCGGGGPHNVCGAPNMLPDGGFFDAGPTCTPLSQGAACAGKNCGIAGDDCGGTYTCGTCTAPQTCGGGTLSSPGTPSVCGGNAGCVPLKACPAGMNCSVISDGCGGVVPCGGGADGGECPPGELCGGGGKPNVCGALNVLPDGAVIDGGLNICTPIPQGTACAGKNCGPTSDGCSGTYDCGACKAPQTCGGGTVASPGTPSVCGGNSGCVPTSACPAAMNCGVIGDGCGGVVQCGLDGGVCPPGELCGGGGQPNVCGAKNVLPDGGVIDGGLNVCTPIPQGTACAGIACGQTGDGCGNLYTCGTCTGLDTCGGGGVPAKCGHPSCTPITTCPAGTCGTIGDGCGGTLPCATCTGVDTCGGGGVPFQCGHPGCVPATTCPSNVNCGPWPDGCGGAIPSCGTCTKPGDTCGGGGVASQCGQPACVPLTACPGGKNCGSWPDGCGGTIPCGTCTPPDICGGSGVPSVCGGGLPDGGVSCVGIQCNIAACDAGVTTSISGHVYDPAGNNPLYNVVVYVPQSAPQAFKHGPFCDTCGSLYTGNPLVATVTDAKGFFRLNGVPTMANLPIVLQIGKWRRQMTIGSVAPCVDNPQPDGSLKLPGAQNNPGTALPDAGPYEGGGTVDDLPEIAISTGGADSMECLLLRIGVSSAEYADGAGGTGHIHIFQGSAANVDHNAAQMSATTPSSRNNLWNSTANLSPYDIVILSCEGEETVGSQPTNLHSYATAGGRVFASHFHYRWFNQGPYNTENLATWHTGANPISDDAGNPELNANVVTTYFDGGVFPRGQALFDFLQNTGALGTNVGGTGYPNDGTSATQLNIHAPKHNADVSAANTPSQPWLVGDTNATVQNATQYFSFDTPTGGTGDAAAPYCGRIVYSDLHVGAASADYPTTGAQGDQPIVPGQCSTATLSPQEKALEFMLFDLSSCVSSDTNLPNPPTCTPLTSCPASVTCGTYPNGCGTGMLNCGNCEGGATCVNGQCVACVPAKACPPNVTCGEWPDGCGGVLQCGSCPVGDACINGACTTGCTKQTCASQKITCGQAGDGCGGVIPGGCGTCAAGQSCVGGTCVTTPCNKVTCAQLGLHCGPAGDGCGGTQDCGDCVPPQTCGGGGVNGVCGQADANLCSPMTCAGQGIQCGPAGDGCGNLLQCGPCPKGQTCGGGGTPGVCGAPNCTPLGCGSLQCGSTGDGCGGLIGCGTCTPPLTCGGGGVNGACGQGDANACQPLTCASLGLKCGNAGDGCGNLLDCGSCPTGQTCGGGGTPGVCGAPNCTPIGCGSLKCGKTGNGCGGVIDCGTCTTPGDTCGGGGAPGVCGQGDANACVPLTCPPGMKCGETGDGCGNLITCGTCTPPLTCGGGGVTGVCGAPSCTPKTCADLNANCGQVADGCGGLTPSCGDCTNNATCGGGGTANQCGSPNCTPRTCTQAGANCGPVADGCGGIIQCGTCTPPQTCGGGGIASQCGGGNTK